MTSNLSNETTMNEVRKDVPDTQPLAHLIALVVILTLVLVVAFSADLLILILGSFIAFMILVVIFVGWFL